jgi:hypothetical protein
MQGFYRRPGRRRRAAGQGHRAVLRAATVSFFLLPVLAGCSSHSSWSGSGQPVAVAPPPNQPAYSSAAQSAPPHVTPSGYDTPEGLPYPKQSLVDFFKQDSASAAAQPPAQPSAAGTPVTASSSAADSMPYPKQSLFSLFQDSGKTPAPAQEMPHPPSTYTPSAQPYVPPQGQPTYGSAQAQSAQTPPAQRPPGAYTYTPSVIYTPSVQTNPPQGQSAARPPQASAPQAAADDDEQSVPGYPTRSLSDIFH